MTRKRELRKTFEALSKLLHEFNIDFDYFYKELRKHYVLEAYKSAKTITRTSLRVGIDRRMVSLIINGIDQYRRTSLLSTILVRIEQQALSSHMLINKTGRCSVEKIITDVANGATTLNSVVKELCELGCIVDLGSTIRYEQGIEHNIPYKQKTLQKFSRHLSHYINDMIKKSRRQKPS